MTIGPFIPPWAAGQSGDCREWSGECSTLPSDKGKFRADWTHFVRTVVNRYKDRVRHFGIWNEPDLRIFFTHQSPTLQLFVDNILKPGADAVRKADPLAKVVGPDISSSAGKLNFLLNRACDKLDIISVHLYTGSTYQQRVHHLKNQYRPKIVQQCGRTKPIWVTEGGFDSNDFGELDQGQQIVGMIRDSVVGQCGCATAFNGQSHFAFTMGARKPRHKIRP